ncbi:hypothetical protein OGAPHI_003047 [Ogataea philodendri]|uniref:Uncharacterized protein n=1 Tax=Ogataea philodendri TaxID=1378263 RepID=A0A9P8T5V2_9ASCO|nr:uncharacterized protein OGAPHI_003047 [Ogataea philodendri]KAH3667398.1 hypothetical protein OGAPHI_003047 [Ogataea philodendri]
MVQNCSVAQLVAVLENIDQRDVDDSTVVESVHSPRPEDLHIEEMAGLSNLVKLRVLVQHVGCDVLVKNTNHQWRQNNKDHVVQGQSPRLHHRLPTEPVTEHVPELGHIESDVLVERVKNGQ